MSMLIRSQNKKCIINLDNIDTIEAKDEKIIYFNGGTDTKGILGSYSTEEKEIKVLDMMQEEYLYCERCRARGEEAGNIPCYVFQMPQDSEV